MDRVTTTELADPDRAFVRIAEGQVHYRHAGEASAAAPVAVYMAHPGPYPTTFAPLVAEVGRSRRVIAPDQLGTGDSAAPIVTDPDIQYYADAVVRVMDALKIDKADYFGCHTGAYIGVELLIRHPDRVRRAIFDGLAVRPEDLRKEMFAHYAPEIVPDDYGRQFAWAFQCVRDGALFFPHFKRDPAHYRGAPMSSAERLHKGAVEILKCITTFHLAYRAVYAHDTGARLPAIEKDILPLMLMASEGDAMHDYLDDSARRVPWARKMLVPGSWAGEAGVKARGKAITDFLDG